MFKEIKGFVFDLPKSPKDMAERLKRVPLWYKGASLITVTALAACQFGKKFGLVVPSPEDTATNPTEAIPSSPTETAAAASAEFLGQEVLETKLTETQTLMDLYGVFETDSKIKSLFADPSGIEYSAMGIKTYVPEFGREVIYPFFSAMSETEKKGYTAMVLQPSAKEVVYVVLNRITDAEGKVGLGITQDLDHRLLENPVMIFATGLTVDQIARMTDEEIAQINLLFIPAGLPVSPSEAPLGVGRYLASLKPIETPTETPTQTPTPEAIFVPEGFEIGEPGLLRDPNTGKDILALNPEANWEAFRLMVIKNIWQANRDWANYTGGQSDASQMSQERFLAKALAGEELSFGIPVRADTKGAGAPQNYLMYLKLETVKARLDNIKLQVLEPDAFRDWLDRNQGSYYTHMGGSGTVHELSSIAVNFCVNEGRLIFSVGSLYTGQLPTAPRDLLIGRFDPSLHQYKSYFDERGIGYQADFAASYMAGWAFEELEHLDGEYVLQTLKASDGSTVKVIFIARTIAYGEDQWNNWNLFTFSK